LTRCLLRETVAAAEIVVAAIAVAEIAAAEVAGAEALAKLRFVVGCLAAHLGCLASEKGRLLETYESSERTNNTWRCWFEGGFPPSLRLNSAGLLLRRSTPQPASSCTVASSRPLKEAQLINRQKFVGLALLNIGTKNNMTSLHAQLQQNASPKTLKNCDGSCCPGHARGGQAGVLVFFKTAV
jgi:hypothetical protein